MAEEDKALIKAVDKLNSTLVRHGKEISRFHEGAKEIHGIFSIVFGFIKDLTSFGPKMDTLGAKFSTSIQGNIEESRKLADAFVKNGVPMSVWDAMSFNLHTNSLALDATTEGLVDLFAVTLATGENYTALARQLGSLTIGTKNQKMAINELAASLEDTARRTNMSREALINAMAKLSNDTLNLMATTSNGSVELQKAMARFKGRIGDERLFNNLSNIVNEMLTFKGGIKARAMGFDISPLVDGNLKSNEIERAILSVLEQLAEYNSNLGFSKVAVRDHLLGTLGDISAAGSIRNKLAENALKEQKGINKGFTKTWDMLKKEIIRPLVNNFVGFFFEMKKMLGSDFGNVLQTVLIGIGKAVAAVAWGLAKLVQWIAKVLDLKGAAQFKLFNEGFKETNTELRRVRAVMKENEKNTNTTANIQKDKRAEETNKKLSEVMRTQAKLSIHQTKAFPVLMKQLIALSKEGNRILKSKDGSPTIVNVGDSRGSDDIKALGAR